MNIYALSSLLASYVFFALGTFIYQKDPKNQLNRIYVLACILLGYLAIVEFGLRNAADADAAHMWLKTGFLWPVAIAVYMHFAIIFTRREKIFRYKATYPLLYVPALIFALLELTTTTLTGGTRREYWGWTYSMPEDSLVHNINVLWFSILTILPLILVFLYMRRAREPLEKRRAKIVFIGTFIPWLVGLATEEVAPIIGAGIPELTLVASTFEVAFIAYGIHKYNIFALTPSIAAEDIVAAMSNMLFLVRKDKTLSLANRSAQHLLGYKESDLIGQQLEVIFAEGEWEKIWRESDYLTKPEYNRETAFITKDGRVIPVFLSISAIQDNYGNNLGLLCIGSDLTDHKRAKEAQKKEIMLKEIHHRVKNNMQIISSLLSLQFRYITDEKYTEMIKESQNRIRSMALIHENLYKSGDLQNINFREYITEIVQQLSRSYGGQDIALTIKVDDVHVDIDTAVPLGLIINELVSNALKYAFPDNKGEITVILRAGDSIIELIVEDDGVGIPSTVDVRTTKTLGLQLVFSLVENQLNGDINLERKKGTEFYITLPVSPY
jgi:PAS domain S-box-containing protein